MALLLLMARSPADAVTRRLLLLSAVLLFTSAVAIWSTGGLVASVAAVRVSARSPGVAAVAGALALMAWLIAAGRRRAVRSDLAAVEATIDRHACALVTSAAALTGAVAVRFHTFSASGADASGYLSEAAMLASGALSHVEPLTEIADWSDALRTLAPLGWQAAVAPAQVPTYAVGLPLLMAGPHAAAGALGASLVVCLSAAVAVWCAGRLAWALAGGAAGVLAALSLATIPVMLFESLQPMSDVPVTAAWLACWWYVVVVLERSDGRSVGAAALAAGLAAAIAVLVRPNLAPLAAVPVLCLWMTSRASRARAVVAFAIPVAIAGVAIAYLQWRWFGSPFRSGYGTATEIYSLTNISPNVRLYWAWLLETRGAWLLLAPVALALGARPVLWWMLAFASLVCGAYLVYGTFETWPYLRFLLPALAIGCIGAAVALVSAARVLPAAARVPLLIALMLAVAGWQTARARGLDVFRIADRHGRALVAGRYIASATPAHAVLLTGEQSGAMRYYSGRSIVRWDILAPASLPLVLRRITERGAEVWVVLDDWEVALFREKFGSTAPGGLDWPPLMDAGTFGRMQAWRLRDRAAFIAGERVGTDWVR